MTVFPALCGDPLGYDGYPDDLGDRISLQEVNDIYRQRAKKISSFSHCRISAVKLEEGFSMRVDGLSGLDRRKLTQAREQLQTLTGMYKHDFAAYDFHITLAYQLKWMPEMIAMHHKINARSF